MTESAGADEPGSPPLGTFAEKLDWLIEHAHPAGRDPYTNAEVAALIEKVAGEKVSYSAIWELRTGRSANPTKRVIEALALTFSVPAGFFFDNSGNDQHRMIAEQVELLALIRDAGIDQVELRAFLGLPPEARKVVRSLIEYAVHAEGGRKGR